MIAKNALIKDLIDLGVTKGDVLNVKASMKSIGNIEGGANTLIEALVEAVGANGTIVTDSFVSVCSPYSIKFWADIVDDQTVSYAGALANALLNFPGAIRSSHPVQKFALLGSRASDLASIHTDSSYAYEVLSAMAKIGGKNLKIGEDYKVPGVGTTHVAIGMSGIRQKRKLSGVRYRDHEGNVRSFYLNWAGACTEALYNLNSLYAKTPNAVLGIGKVGNATAKLTSMKVTLDAELQALQSNPRKFLRCKSSECISCKFSWENHQDNFCTFLKEIFKSRNFRKLVRACRIKFFYQYKP